MKEKLLNNYLYVFDNEPYEITTEANGIYIQEEFVKGFAYLNPSLVNKMIPINYYVVKANTPEWYSYMVSTDPQPAPLGPDSSLPDNPELVVDGDNITVSEYGNKFMLFSNPNNIQGVIYNSTNENVAYFSSEVEGQVEIAGPGNTMLSQEFAGDDEYLPFSKSYNLEVEDITVDPEIAWSQNSATVQIGESNSFPTISNPHGVGLTFASSDESVATIDQSTGAITLVSAGNCTIACISIQDADYYSSTVEYSLTVLAAKVNPDLTWSFSPATVQIGETNLFPVLQNGDSVSPIVYSSSNQAIATVDPATGAVSLVAPGSCYITASFAGNTQYNAYTISYELTVLSAKVNPGFHYRQGTGTYDIYTETASVPPLDNPNDVSPITYSSSDTSVATVNSDGTINYLAVGSTTITASFAGNSQYLASNDSFVLTISDSRPLEDNISFAEETLDPQFIRPLFIHLNNPDNLEFTVSTNETGQWRYVYTEKVDSTTIKVINGYLSEGNSRDNIDITVVSQGDNPKTIVKSLTFGPYKMDANYIQFNINGTSIDSQNGWFKSDALSEQAANEDYLIYTFLNNPTNMYYDSYTNGRTWNGKTVYPQSWLKAYDRNDNLLANTAVDINNLSKSNGYISLGGNVQSGYVENTQIYIKFVSDKFTIVNGNNLGGGVLSGSYITPKENLTGQFYDDMNQSTISSISLSNYDIPSYDRYQLKFTDYTGNLANELNVSDLTITSPDPGCNITVRSRQVSGNDIIFNLGINSTVNVSGNITISTPETTHFHSSSTSIPLTITGIKPALNLISKNVPTNINPGQVVNCSWQFEVPYGFRWDGQNYTVANCYVSDIGAGELHEKYSPSSPTATFTYDDQASITVMEVSFSTTLDSTAPIGKSDVYIQLQLNMSSTYADYSDLVYQTVVSPTPTTKTVSVLSNSFVNANESSTTSETFRIGHLDYGDRILSADLVVSYTTNSSASISISNVSLTHNDMATETDVDVSFDLTVGTGVAANDTVSIFAELTDNGAGYSMSNTNVGLITLNQQTINIDTTRFNARSNNNGGIYFDLYSDLQINSIETYTMSDDFVNSLLQQETYTSDGIYNYKCRVEMPNEKGILDAATVDCKLVINNAGVGVGPITKNISFANPLI